VSHREESERGENERHGESGERREMN
jgi:hypothetical protein